MRRKLAAGNWKMNGTAAALEELAEIANGPEPAACDVLICPPSTLLSRAAEAIQGKPVSIGGQDCQKRDKQ